jgi:hypothetical protein
MHIQKMHAVSGPNLWSAAPVVTVTIDTAGVEELGVDSPKGFADRLDQGMPKLAEQGVEFLERLKAGLPTGDVVAWIELPLG